jgi:hypothetical protein
MYQGQCINCPVGCAQCSITQLGQCTSCLPGYFYNAQTQVCQTCSQANCISCNSMACLACAPGFIVSPSLTCQLQCASPCATCSQTNPTECLSCIAGYTLNTNSLQNCQPNLSCNANGTCNICPFGYSLLVVQFNSTCVQCVSGCQRCNPNNPNACFTCNQGFYLNGTTCSACPSFCTMCSSATICFSCASGFVAQQAATLPTSTLSTGNGVSNVVMQPVRCLACTSPCATCFNSPTTCLSCEANFVLSGTVCQGQFALQVSVTFNPAGNDYSIFNENYNQIMNGLASAAGVSLSAINVKSIIYNSVILNAAVTSNNSPDSDAARNMQNSINSYFANLAIPNLVVVDSSTSGTTTPDTNSDSSNTTLIVAIVVPIVSVGTSTLI